MNTHQKLVTYLTESGKITQPRVAEAFATIDRADFVLPGTDDQMTYSDHSLSIHYGQTISQPSTVAFMLELLKPQRREKILDVGTGSGWTSALLGHIVGRHGHVYGVEIVPELVLFGRANVSKYHGEWVTISQARHGHVGDPAHAPYDRILVSAAAQEVPQELLEQLKIGGAMVIPVHNDIVRIYKRNTEEYEIQRFGGFVFVPLVP
jgi:protein-L-isoaspartate(D-aspartate) O-methyltransferase